MTNYFHTYIIRFVDGKGWTILEKIVRYYYFSKKPHRLQRRHNSIVESLGWMHWKLECEKQRIHSQNESKT